MNKALNHSIHFESSCLLTVTIEYSIDNTATECAIRQIIKQRKNSMFFRSVQGVQNSAVYNMFIETCKQVGLSFRDYLCKLFKEFFKRPIMKISFNDCLPIKNFNFVDIFSDWCRQTPI